MVIHVTNFEHALHQQILIDCLSAVRLYQGPMEFLGDFYIVGRLVKSMVMNIYLGGAYAKKN
jgi:hypothetical protein